MANSYLRPKLQPGDEILVTHMEHHANIVPWQMLCEQTGAVLKVVPINERGELKMDELKSMLSERVKLLGIVHVSNALGTVNPVAEVCRLARTSTTFRCWWMARRPCRIRVLMCRPWVATFYCLSAHKMYGPTGIGALWAREATLDAMPPWQGGGEMIRKVTFEKTTWNDLPAKFEAGTPHIAGGVGLAAAIDYLSQFDMREVMAYEQRCAQICDAQAG